MHYFCVRVYLFLLFGMFRKHVVIIWIKMLDIKARRYNSIAWYRIVIILAVLHLNFLVGACHNEVGIFYDLLFFFNAGVYFIFLPDVLHVHAFIEQFMQF